MSTKLLTIVLSIVVFLLVLELTRRERLSFKYASGWIVVALAGFLFSIFDTILFDVAYALGFALPSNFIFFSLLGIFIFLALLLTVFLCQQNVRNDIMAQKIGILEQELEELKSKGQGK